ncbi:chloroplast isoprene synthase [Salix suchowensis]|nr:chloroplast isoprene synthase [Salix suchowensis]
MATEFLSLQRPFSLTHKMYRNPLPRVIKATPLTLKLRCSVSTRNVSLTETETKTETRRSANYEPNSWDYDYLLSSDTDDAIELYKDKAKKLDAEVRRGFEAVAKTSLQATALSFRLLRQHGFDVSQEVFSGFKDQNGNFMENLKEDIKAILNLYEASFLALEGENILDEAKVFTISHLKELNEGKIGKDMAEQVNNALELPLHRRTQRLEAVWSIEAYRKKEDANRVLLELAILDYNMVQSIYQRDLRETSRWDIFVVDDLPDYMKLCFLALYNTINEIAYDNLKEKGENILPYLTKVAEIARGETANSVSCYMRTKGISEELATESVMNLIDETWKKMNKEKLGDSLFAKHFVETTINLARQSHCTYHNGDTHTSLDELTRKRVLSVITEPILPLEI